MSAITMLEMVARFPKQLEEAMIIGREAKITPGPSTINQVFVTGMGGSGIGGDFIASFVQDKLAVPYIVGKRYDIPNWIDGNTIFIASSYSGNTEETLSAIEQATNLNPKIICISSGGKILQLAKLNSYDFVALPNNWSSPRACLGFSIVAQLYVLNKLNLLSDSFTLELKKTISRLETEVEELKQKAKHLAESLFNKTIIIYSTDRIEPVALRFRQQLNENAKRLCWHHVIPEMNHNELVGWRVNDENLAVLFLRNSDDHPRNQVRSELTKEVVSHFAGTTIEVYSKGDSIIERSLYLVHLLDYTSVYLAELNKVDSVEVKVIEFLKNELAKV